MKFPLARFEKFCSSLPIDSKEMGRVTLAKKKQLGTQRYAIEEIVRGLEEGVHFFDILKARQLGITTITLALDLFWHFEHPGMQGTLAVDGDDNKDMFRSTLQLYHAGLPGNMRVPLVQDNRNMMAFGNRSRMLFQIGGGARKKGTKGRGKGLIFLHATETASWDDPESLASILASLAETNPLRLYVFESTARGYNLRHDMWKTAKNSVTKKAIFIGWWQNELYRKEAGSVEYETYWDGAFTGAELEWVRAVKLLYGYDITPEQMAWWRWKLEEQIMDENMMMQEFPPTERHAFILTGQNFFSLPLIEREEQRLDSEPAPGYWRYKFGETFLHTAVEQVNEQIAQLSVYELPDPQGFYSIGGDPAFGSSEWADRFAISVWRCYADRFEQVAEFCTPHLTTFRYAWVLCSLAGLYRQSRINLEINGPGEAVMNEINTLRRQASSIPSRSDGKELQDVLGSMKYYLYRRLDSPTGGTGVYHTLTTHKMKERMLNGFNDLIEKGEAVIHSEELLDEMKIFIRDEGTLGAPDRAKDDRVIAASLAAVQYIEHMRIPLEQMGVTWAKERARRAQREETGKDVGGDNQVSKAVRTYMDRVGLRMP